MPKQEIAPEIGDLWQRNPGTLPPFYDMSLIERPDEELREMAYLREVTEEVVSYRRDAEAGPPLYFLPRMVFLRDFSRLTPARPINGESSDSLRSGLSSGASCLNSHPVAATATA